MARILGTVIALVLLVVFAYPFVRDAYYRSEVRARLADERDRLEFDNWKGDPASFMRSRYSACQMSNGRGAPACDRYRVASD